MKQELIIILMFLVTVISAQKCHLCITSENQQVTTPLPLLKIAYALYNTMHHSTSAEKTASSFHIDNQPHQKCIPVKYLLTA